MTTAASTITVSIPSEYVPFVRKLIADGDYENESAVLAECLRLLQSKERFRLEIKKGFDEIAQGQVVSAEEVFARARKRIEEIAAAKCDG